MSDSGVLSEFDPLAASKSAPGQPVSQDEDKQTSATDTKSSVLDEFDPLTRQGGAIVGQASCTVKQDSAAPIQSSLTMSVSTSQSSSDIPPHKPAQPHPGGFQSGSSKVVGSAHGVEPVSTNREGDVAIAAASQSALSEPSKSDRIGAEISQIDSVLKALNMGQFDIATVSSFTAQSQPYDKPKSSQPHQAEAMPAAARSTGLNLIGQLGSGDSGSSSESEDSSSDSSGDSMGLARELHRGHESGSDDGGGPAGGGRQQRIPMSKGEIDYRTLPPDRCHVPFPEGGTVMPMGKVSHLAEKLVVIQALPGTPPFDEGTVLWTKEKKSIAKIFETFGPVKSPLYSVLIESDDHATSLGLTPGQVVYVIPSDMKLSKYVFTQQLMKEKGSDASWKDDIEVPPHFKEYSDDESEQAANKAKKGGKRTRTNQDINSV